MLSGSKKIFYAFLAFFIIAFPLCSFSMQSANYTIEKDSINFSGMDDSGSESYRLSDTLGEVGTGEGQCTGVSCDYLLGGYRQEDSGGIITAISISSPSNVALSPSIGGVAGGVATGDTAWTVITNSTTGYQMTIKASTSPAMQSGSYSFADYVTSGSDPDYDWSVASGASEFGYSVEGAHTVSKFLDNGSGICNLGSGNVTDRCWLGFSTSDEPIASSSLPNEPSGTSTAVKFRAEAGSQRMQQPGSYTATIVVTAVAL